MLLGLDYSAGRPSGAAVHAAGYRFVVRYCGRPGAGKNVTRAEVEDMVAHGVAVCLVFESTATRASQGRTAGEEDARAAVDDQARVGIPSSRPIFYAVDFDADPAAVEPYFRGVQAVHGADGAYGSFRVVRRLRADRLAGMTWQTVAWSHRQRDAGSALFQRLGQVTVDGVECDVNEAGAVDFGQWPAPASTPSPTRDEDDMVIISAPHRPWLAYYPTSGSARVIGPGEQVPLQAVHAAAKDTVVTHQVSAHDYDLFVRYLDRGLRGTIPGLAAIAQQVAALTAAMTHATPRKVGDPEVSAPPPPHPAGGPP